MSPHVRPVTFVEDAIPLESDDAIRTLGRKGTSLRRLAAQGLRVPRGFIIASQVCREYLDSGGRWPAGTWEAVVEGVRELERRTGRAYGPSVDGDQAPRSTLTLSVRSGAVESMPGLLKTVLNVGSLDPTHANCGPRTVDPLDRLRVSIESVFDSWNGETAVDYRNSHGIDHASGTAVTVQEMIRCEYSGVLFTQSPASDRRNTLTLEFVAGLGDRLVAGLCDPYRCTVVRDDPHAVASWVESAGLPAHLADALTELCRVGVALETEFDGPLDVEWGVDESGLTFFQARQIVSSAPETDCSDVLRRERRRLQRFVHDGARMWVRHNLDETLPQPTPFTWSLWRQFMSAAGGLGTLYRRLGYRPSGADGRGEILCLIGGRIFADPERAAGLFGDNFPLRFDPELLRRDPFLLDQGPTRFAPDTTDPWFLWKFPCSLIRLVRVRRTLNRLFRTAAERFETQVVPPYLDVVAEQQRRPMSDLDSPKLIELIEDRRRQVFDEFGPESLLVGMLGTFAYAELERRLVRVLGSSAGRSLANDVVPNGDVRLAGRQRELLAAAGATPAGLDAFLKEFGHRAVGEMELAAPRWRETPELVRRIAENQARSDQDVASNGSREMTYDMAVKLLDGELRRAGSGSLAKEANAWLDRCWKYLPYRERGKHLFLTGYELLRNVAEELAKRIGLGRSLYELEFGEWPDLVTGKDFAGVRSERQRDAQAFRRWKLPLVIEAADVESLTVHGGVPPTGVRSFEGTPIAGGEASGKAWNPSGDQLIEQAGADDVLVCQALEPSWGPLLGRTSAVVVEQGGSLSHGAVLARQWGIPVVRLPGATELFATGQRLHVDGNAGRVQVIDGVQP